MKYNPETNDGVVRIMKPRLPKQVRENVPLYRLTEVGVNGGTIKALNRLLKAVVMTAQKYSDNDLLGISGDLLWRLIVWPTPSDYIKSLSILVPFRHDQSASIRLLLE